METIYQAALWINLAIWSVVGLVCWIPLLARSTAALSGAILISTFTKSDPSHLKEKFENAVSFYARGFDAIHRVLGEGREKFARRNSDTGAVPTPKTNWDQIIKEIIWTLVFWGTLLFSLYGFVHWFTK
jgi:hypothetical protein